MSGCQFTAQSAREALEKLGGSVLFEKVMTARCLLWGVPQSPTCASPRSRCRGRWHGMPVVHPPSTSSAAAAASVQRRCQSSHARGPVPASLLTSPTTHSPQTMEQVLTSSDANGSGRLVIPKSQAEVHFPFLEQQAGMTLHLTDTDGGKHAWRLRFWVNNQSRWVEHERVGRACGCCRHDLKRHCRGARPAESCPSSTSAAWCPLLSSQDVPAGEHSGGAAEVQHGGRWVLTFGEGVSAQHALKRLPAATAGCAVGYAPLLPLCSSLLTSSGDVLVFAKLSDGSYGICGRKGTREDVSRKPAVRRSGSGVSGDGSPAEGGAPSSAGTQGGGTAAKRPRVRGGSEAGKSKRMRERQAVQAVRLATGLGGGGCELLLPVAAAQESAGF